MYVAGHLYLSEEASEKDMYAAADSDRQARVARNSCQKVDDKKIGGDVDSKKLEHFCAFFVKRTSRLRIWPDCGASLSVLFR